jgi:hypothetical protein
MVFFMKKDRFSNGIVAATIAITIFLFFRINWFFVLFVVVPLLGIAIAFGFLVWSALAILLSAVGALVTTLACGIRNSRQQ